jgi:hypothetical protein
MPRTKTEQLTNVELFYWLEDLTGRIACGRFDQQDLDTLWALQGEVALRALRN